MLLDITIFKFQKFYVLKKTCVFCFFFVKYYQIIFLYQIDILLRVNCQN